MRILTVALCIVILVMSILLLHAHRPVFAGMIQPSFWGGSQDAAMTTLELGIPWTLRYRNTVGAYTADLPSLPSNIGRVEYDFAIPSTFGDTYIGYSELRHVQYGPETVTWLFQDFLVGMRGSGHGLLAIEFDAAVIPFTHVQTTGTTFGFGTLPTPGRWYGFDLSLGVRWTMGDATVRVGFTDWKRYPEVSPGDHWDTWMQWSGPYLAVSF